MLASVTANLTAGLPLYLCKYWVVKNRNDLFSISLLHLKHVFAFKNAGNNEEPSTVGYSFNQRQVNEIGDMQLCIRDGTIN